MSHTTRWKRADGDHSPTVGDLVRGAVGVAKAALGVQAAPTEVVRARWAACLACEDHDCGKCSACGCFTGAKVRVAGESCPRGAWVAVTVGSSDEVARSAPSAPGGTRRGCCGRRKADAQGDQ
jgi:hypothetical protein